MSARARVRGIYATALTHLLGEAGHEVVQASPPIRERFDRAFPADPATVTVDTTRDRQGVTVAGDADGVAEVVAELRVARDALAWRDPAARGATFAGVVTDERGSGAVVDLGDGVREAFLPYRATDGYVEEGDVVTVQVHDPRPRWIDGRPEVGIELRVEGELVTLARGERANDGGGVARYEDLLPVEVPDGWHARWGPAAEEASMDALGDALERAGEAVGALDDALAGADPDEAPTCLAAPLATTHVWFGRESRFALDDERRAAAATMPGHHRVKAGADAASAAVDFVEAICADALDDGAFPFDVVTRQFGPREGDRIAIEHGKPDGRLVTLGRGEVTEVGDGSLRLEREMSPGGSYDALGVERRAGDVAVTKFREGRWWYATVYRGADGERRGTYVNVCTPVELFPEAVRYVDLHVDVVKDPDGEIRRVDDDELDEAVENGNVPESLAEQARAVASKVERAL
jgi:Ribonuclease G/E